jgi:hypothetical protein
VSRTGPSVVTGKQHGQNTKRVSGIPRRRPSEPRSPMSCGSLGCVRVGGGEMAGALLQQLMPVRPAA